MKGISGLLQLEQFFHGNRISLLWPKELATVPDAEQHLRRVKVREH
jgi:hypothetical protein